MPRRTGGVQGHSVSARGRIRSVETARPETARGAPDAVPRSGAALIQVRRNSATVLGRPGSSDAECPGFLLGTDEKAEGMPSGVSKHVQRLAVVVSTVVQQGGPEVFGALPLTLQFLDAGHTEVVMHLLRYIVRGPGRSREGRDLLESEHATSRRVEQDQPASVIVAAISGDLIAGAIPETEELPVELRETAAVGGIDGGVHQNRVGGHLRLLLCV